MAKRKSKKSPLKTFVVRDTEGTIGIYRTAGTPTVAPHIDLYGSIRNGRTTLSPVTTVNDNSGLFKGLKVGVPTEITGLSLVKE